MLQQVDLSKTNCQIAGNQFNRIDHIADSSHQRQALVDTAYMGNITWTFECICCVFKYLLRNMSSSIFFCLDAIKAIGRQ